MQISPSEKIQCRQCSYDAGHPFLHEPPECASYGPDAWPKGRE